MNHFDMDDERNIIMAMYTKGILIHVNNEYECAELLKVFARHGLDYYYSDRLDNGSLSAEDAKNFKKSICYGIITHPIKTNCVKRFNQTDFHNDFKYVVEFNIIYRQINPNDKQLSTDDYSDFTLTAREFWHIIRSEYGETNYKGSN